MVDQDTAALLFSERYDTYDSRNDSQRLAQLLRSLPVGRIVTLAVGDSAERNLGPETREVIKEKLGSRFVLDLQYR